MDVLAGSVLEIMTGYSVQPLEVETEVMVWSAAPTNQRNGLLCEERESSENSAERLREIPSR